jgi:hypothetical protein
MSSHSVGIVVTTTYLYDPNDERIALGANGATTTFPFTFYNVATSSGGAATITKHIFANGEDVADVQGAPRLPRSTTSTMTLLAAQTSSPMLPAPCPR